MGLTEGILKAFLATIILPDFGTATAALAKILFVIMIPLEKTRLRQ